MFRVEEAAAMRDSIVEWRRYLHRNPETGLELPHTVDYVCSVLDGFGVPYKRLGDNGVLATISGGRPGRTIALRADMDALPVQETADVPYRSEIPGKGHMCGHDAHTAMLLGAAKLLHEHREDMAGTARLIFQPGEELALGAKLLVETYHVMDGVDRVFGIHIMSSMPLPTGAVVYSVGPSLAACGEFRVTITGRGGHGSMPHTANDPIVAGAHFVTAAQTIVSRNVDAQDAAVLTLGQFQGGSAPNVIPESVRITGTIRTLKNPVMDLVLARLKEILAGLEAMFGVRCEFELDWILPVLDNDPAVMEETLPSVKKIVGDKLVRKPNPTMGSEDFSFYLNHAPGCFLFLSAGNPSEGYTLPPHNPGARFDDSVLHVGAAVYAQVAFDYLA